MRITEDYTEIKQKLVAMKCDRCGVIYNDIMEIQEFHSINHIGGYSSVFGDMNNISCDICQKCLKELIGEFAKIQYAGDM